MEANLVEEKNNMIILVPIPEISSGVEVGETVAIISLDMAVVKSISEVTYDINNKGIGNTRVIYHNGSEQYINIKFTKVLSSILNTTSMTIVEHEGLARASEDVASLIQSKINK